MAKYGKKAQEEVGKMLHEQKHDHRFKNRKQAIAVGLSKARREGGKAPEKPND
ncbi:MAG: hypothetical protein JWN38_967 [Candidatus Saccharibacteria bacterium]|nr:hypothetical protein [Candidatus Saccharibacteria bacterium]